jgi:peptidoglycan hydrolase-like protein with peptidoglycan-binding domain
VLTSPKFRNSQRLQAAANNAPLLKSPEQGEAVRLLQEALVSLGYSFPQSMTGGRLDGIYGNETVQKVAQFQRAQGMMADGIAGKNTLLRLDALIGGSGGGSQPGGSGANWGQPAGGGQSGGGGAWGQRIGGGGGGQGNAGGAGGPQSGAGGGQGFDPSLYATCLRVGSVMVCPHRGQVRGMAIPGTDLLSGSYPGQVTNCQNLVFLVPGNSMYGPEMQKCCRTVHWTGIDHGRIVNGHPVVRKAGAGVCFDSYGKQSGQVILVSG